MRWLLLAVLLGAGCHADDGGHGHNTDGAVDCTTEDRAEPYTPGMTAVGDNGYSVTLVESLPNPPARDDNRWTIDIVDDGDVPVAGLEVEVVPWMPDHNHGARADPVISPGEIDGRYIIDPVNLWMPGYWEVTVEFSNSTPVDAAVVRLCIDQ